MKPFNRRPNMVQRITILNSFFEPKSIKLKIKFFHKFTKKSYSFNKYNF